MWLVDDDEIVVGVQDLLVERHRVLRRQLTVVPDEPVRAEFCVQADRVAVGIYELAVVEPPIQVLGVQMVELGYDVLGDRRPRPRERDA